MSARLWLVGVGAAVVVGLLARVACLSAEMWLDEIWSWEFARTAASPVEIFLRYRHDNNHHLNTLYLYFCPDGGWWLYRLHSLIAGVLTIGMAAKVALRWGRAAAVVAAWLVAGCSWLVLASAEARGYALAMLFALIAFDALWTYLDTKSRPSLAVYWGATVLGFLSHLTFMLATIGFVVWSLRRFGRERRSPGDELRRLLLTHGPPGVVVALFYLVSVRGMDIAGGPPAATIDVLASLIGTATGTAPGWWSLPGVVACIVIFALAVRRLIVEGSDVWVFFVTSCLAAPALYLVGRPEFLFERYFFLPLTFFLILAAKALAPASVPDSSVWKRLGLPSLLALYLLGNGVTVWRYTDAGRGQFHEALALVAQSPDATVSGDQLVRLEKYLGFYGRDYLGREFTLVAPEERPEWFFIHRPDDKFPPPKEELRSEDGATYRLVRAFPSRGPWAWGWFLYRRVPKDDVGRQ